jgi:hypothetical protein
MKQVLITAALAAVGALAVPSIASANYTITKAEAQRNARDAAEYLYGDAYGVQYAYTAASCRPQYTKYNPRYAYHRWVCGWAGPDWENDTASGRLRITGHSNGTYGYMVLAGIRWA